MTDEKNPIEQALDVLVYAPLGFVFSAGELFPSLVEKGRSQLSMAKMVGQFAVQQGQTEAGKVFDKASKQALATLEQLSAFNRSGNGNGNGASANGASANGAAAKVTPAPAPAPAAPIEVAVVEERVAEQPAVATSGPEAAELAIPDYDSLSASQVLPRLTGLAIDELEAVRAYEAAHRGRKTILNRVAQLQTS